MPLCRAGVGVENQSLHVLQWQTGELAKLDRLRRVRVVWIRDDVFAVHLSNIARLQVSSMADLYERSL